ncbi:hypothetical protein [Microcoleus sp. herbarium12]
MVWRLKKHRFSQKLLASGAISLHALTNGAGVVKYVWQIRGKMV